jgi:hypothetical protein
MIGRVARALWTKSPAELTAAARRRLRGSPGSPAAARASTNAYSEWLLEELHAYIAATYPDTALPKARFAEILRRYQHPDWTRPVNRYIGDLWYAFAPDFATRLGDYYRYTDLQLTLTLFAYSTNTPVLEANYLRPYRIAKERLNRFSILEVGAGLPHGFLHGVFSGDAASFASLTTVDIDGVPARFVEFFCRRHRLTHRWITAVAGEAAPVDGGPFDFVFAKDVFEHLTNPRPALDGLLRSASDHAVLALDLEDKGDVVYQHVSPVLEPLRERVIAAGFTPIDHAGNLSIYERRRGPAG